MTPSKTPIHAITRKAWYILREEGPFVFLDRLVRAGIVRIRRKFRDTEANTRRWHALRGKYAGQRAFLVGNGPSLNSSPLHLLAGEQTMCFNRFNLMFERLAWRPSMFSVIDDRVLRDMTGDLDAVIGEVGLAFFPDLHPYNIDFTKRIAPRDNVLWLHPDLLTFSVDLPWCGINKTVANVGLQILAYLGFTEIYLLGVDVTYARQESVRHLTPRNVTATADDDPNHFDPRYFGAGRKYHHPRMDETLEKFTEAHEFYSERGVRIMNAGVGGALNVFPRVDLRSVLGVPREEELRRLLVPTGRQPIGTTLRETFPEAVSLAPGQDWPSGAPVVLCRTDDGASRIARAIFEYVPFGPYENEYLFIKRTSSG